MGFLVKKYHPRQVIKEACTIKERNQIIKKTYKTYYHRQNGSYTGDYLLFLDIETDGILGELGTEDYIPNIKQLACIVFKTKDFFKLKSIVDFPLSYEYKNLNSHKDYIIRFIELYKTYEYPCLIAHNGCAFDFKIIISHINRYVPKNSLTLKKFRAFDTYVAIRQSLTKQNKNKCPRQSLKNVSLFMRHSINYEQHSYLANFAHQALPDCKMMSLWVHALRYHLNWNRYTGYCDI